MKHSITLVTAPTVKVAEKLARALVDRKLAACVNIVPRVTSIYRWKGKTQRNGEVLMVIKSRKDRHAALEKAILAAHPYDVPEIIHLPIDGGSRPYLGWIDRSIGRRGFVRFDHMILIALIAVGAAIGIPAFLRLLRSEGPPNSAWGGVIVGGLMVLAGAGTFVKWALTDLLEKRRKS